MAKRKTVYEKKKMYSEMWTLVIHCICSAGFSFSSFNFPPKEAAGFPPRHCFHVPSNQYSLQIEDTWWGGSSLDGVKNAQKRDKIAAFKAYPISAYGSMPDKSCFQRKPRWYCPQRKKMFIQGWCVRILRRNISTIKVAQLSEPLLIKGFM